MPDQPSAPSNLQDFTAYRAREYTALVAELLAARARRANGPEILWLVNELVLATEDILEFNGDCSPTGEAQGCCVEAERFMVGLVRHAEAIRAANGAFDSRFVDFVKQMPIEAPRRAA
ncbi:hypothetical protein [Maricaulis sp.]|uniref:hypothetical protein n=1 Tax=Maricaulis sp. TaxID=1486257 RepID=UPI002B275118|nr:hypothetical protein [Maricaulis sp.]